MPGTLTFEMKFAESAAACSLFSHLQSRRNETGGFISECHAGCGREVRTSKNRW